MENKLYIIGDTHWPEFYFPIIDKITEEDANAKTIHVGDLNIGVDGNDFPAEWNINHRFIRGNHDNPAVCKTHPNYLGEYGYLEEYDLFYYGGAATPIWAKQRYNGDYFPDEELNFIQAQAAIDLYAEVKPRFVVTHDAPRDVIQAEHPDEIIHNRTVETLQEMFQTHRPTAWFYGHHHHGKVKTMKKTTFICVAQNGFVEVKL